MGRIYFYAGCSVCSAGLNSMINMINKAAAVCKHVYHAVPAALNIRTSRINNKIRPLNYQLIKFS